MLEKKEGAELPEGRQHPFSNLPAVITYLNAAATARKTREALEALREEGRRLAGFQKERSSGPRCAACGGPSYPAPNQYRGHTHASDCRRNELEAAREAAHNAEMARRGAEQQAREAVNVAIAETELGRTATAKGMTIRLDRTDDTIFSIWDNKGGDSIATGTWEDVNGYFGGTHATIESLGFRGSEERE